MLSLISGRGFLSAVIIHDSSCCATVLSGCVMRCFFRFFHVEGRRRQPSCFVDQLTSHRIDGKGTRRRGVHQLKTFWFKADLLNQLLGKLYPLFCPYIALPIATRADRAGHEVDFVCPGFESPPVHILIRVKLLTEEDRKIWCSLFSHHNTRKKGAPDGRPAHLLSTPSCRKCYLSKRAIPCQAPWLRASLWTSVFSSSSHQSVRRLSDFFSRNSFMMPFTRTADSARRLKLLNRVAACCSRVSFTMAPWRRIFSASTVFSSFIHSSTMSRETST